MSKLSLDTINAISPSCNFITLWHLNFIVYLQIRPYTITTPAVAEWRRHDAYMTQNCMCVIQMKRKNVINCMILFKRPFRDMTVGMWYLTPFFQYKNAHTYTFSQSYILKKWNSLRCLYNCITSVRTFRCKVHWWNWYILLSQGM